MKNSMEDLAMSPESDILDLLGAKSFPAMFLTQFVDFNGLGISFENLSFEADTKENALAGLVAMIYVPDNDRRGSVLWRLKPLVEEHSHTQSCEYDDSGRLIRETKTYLPSPVYKARCRLAYVKNGKQIRVSRENSVMTFPVMEVV
jgi:hypothetical protein